MNTKLSYHLRVAFKTLWVGVMAIAFALTFNYMWNLARAYAPQDELLRFDFEMPKSWVVVESKNTNNLDSPQVINLSASNFVKAFRDDPAELLVLPTKMLLIYKKGDITFVADARVSGGWNGDGCRYMGRGYYYSLNERFGVLQGLGVSAFAGAVAAASVGYPTLILYQLFAWLAERIRRLRRHSASAVQAT